MDYAMKNGNHNKNKKIQHARFMRAFYCLPF